MNWYIGQEIVAIRDHEDGDFKTGTVFTILSLQNSTCLCEEIEIHIGTFFKNNSNRDYLRCDACNTSVRVFDKKIFYSEVYFSPLDSLMSKEIKELLTDLPQHLQNIENEKIYLETKKNYKDNGIYEDNEQANNDY